MIRPRCGENARFVEWRGKRICLRSRRNRLGGFWKECYIASIAGGSPGSFFREERRAGKIEKQTPDHEAEPGAFQTAKAG